MKKLLLLLMGIFALQTVYAQKDLLTGQISDSKGNPLQNVAILVRGTDNGTTTDVKGNFMLNGLPDTFALKISYLGFEPQEVEIDLSKGIKNISIALDAKTYALQEVVLRANKSLVENSVSTAKVQLESVPGGTNLVPMEKLELQRSLSLKDALEMQPGVMIQEFFGSNDQPRLNIRGSGIQSNPQRRGINLLQDGVTTNFADGSYIIGILEPRAANYIEVFRGANGLKYGATTLGGAINLVSRNGYQVSPLELRVEGGSFDYFGTSFATGGVFGKNDIYASLSYNNTEGFRDFNTSSRLNAMVNVGRRFSDRFENRLLITYTDLDFDIPGPLTQAQLDEDPTQINPGVNPPISTGPNVVRDMPGRESDIIRLVNSSIFKINENSSLNLGLYYQYGDDTFDFPITVGVRNSISNDLGLNASFTSITEKNNLSLGINASTGKIDRSYSVIRMGEAGATYAENELTATNFVFYAEDIYKLTPKLSGVLSLQLSSNTRNNKDVFATPEIRPFFNFANQSSGTFLSADSSLDLDYFGFNPKVGLIYDLDEQKQLFFNVSRSYEPPTFDELINIAGGNPNKSPEIFTSVDLDEQTATTLEFGSRGTLGTVRWDLSFYNAWVKNEILTTTDLFGIAGVTRNSPDRTIHQGIELGVYANILEDFILPDDRLFFNTVYNYSNFYFNEGIYDGNQIAGIPRHYINAAIGYRPVNDLFLELNTEWLPEDTPTDHQNTVFQQSYQLFGFRIGYHRPKWSVFVHGNNITDEKYASSYLIRDVVTDPPPPVLDQSNVTTFIPGVGINFSVGINYKL
ncbi:MAG: TonB-dependent receptor [Bacteroidota bacterium]